MADATSAVADFLSKTKTLKLQVPHKPLAMPGGADDPPAPHP